MLFTAINTKLASALAGVALAAAVAAPAAVARPLPAAPMQQNVGSPDARDANNGYHPQLGEAAQVIGSPDARDANNRYDPQLPAAQPTAVNVSAPAPSGFDWASAAIGAAAGTGLLIVLLASAKSVAVVSRRIRVAR
jgi:hypothetical protein